MERRMQRRERTPVSDLNITNLVDVTFALLIIFMISAPMMTQGVQIDLPRTDAPAVESSTSITVAVTGRSEIYLNREKVPLLNFGGYFREVFADRTEIPVLIYADRQVPYGSVAAVITEIQRAGAVKLGFITEPPDVRKKR